MTSNPLTFELNPFVVLFLLSKFNEVVTSLAARMYLAQSLMRLWLKDYRLPVAETRLPTQGTSVLRQLALQDPYAGDA